MDSLYSPSNIYRQKNLAADKGSLQAGQVQENLTHSIKNIFQI